MASLSVTLPPALQSWLDARVAEDGYADGSEYLRDLIRRHRRESEDEVQHVRHLIEEGLASGIVDEEPEAVLEAIIAQRRGA